MCFKSKNIYNYANYLIRKEFVANKTWLKYKDLANICKDSEPYRDLGSNVGQQTLKILDRNWCCFFKTLKDWSKYKEKYNGSPKLPKYLDKNGRFVLGVDNIKCSLRDGYLRFSWKPLKQLNKTFKIKIPNDAKLIQVRFVPKGSSYNLEIVYEIEVPDTIAETNRISSIDLGIDNFATITNNIGKQPIVVKGGIIKSINQYYNKELARIKSELKLINNRNWSKRLQSLTEKRNNKVKDFMHKVSKNIITWCVENQIDTIVIGNNKGWKQEINIGKVNNQKFVNIPYEMFVNQVKYKAENFGIKVIEQEESYTSGTSFIDGELPIKECYNKSRRKYRGLFISNKGIKVNADVNGSYQIMVKAIPDAFSNGIEGVGLHPTTMKIA